MSRFNDLTGKRFGRLVVVQRTTPQGAKVLKWQCLCDCGNYTEVAGFLLIRGTTKSCGCLQQENRQKKRRLRPAEELRSNLTGRRFGMLTAIRRAPLTAEKFRRYVFWECRCDCGNTVIVRAQSLKRGATTSCGCATGRKKSESYRKTMEKRNGIQRDTGRRTAELPA